MTASTRTTVPGPETRLFRRLPCLVVAFSMLVRAQWLATQPFSVAVPWWAPALFGVGGTALLGMYLWPRHWVTRTRMAAIISVTTPYILYCVWVLDAFPFGRVRGTVFDLAALPIVVSWAWNKPPITATT